MCAYTSEFVKYVCNTVGSQLTELQISGLVGQPNKRATPMF